MWRAVLAALAATQPDLLHIQYQTGAYGMHPAINLLPWRLRRLPNHPRVAVTAHDLLEPYLFPKAGPLRGWITRRLLADSDAVVVTNEADLARVMGDRSWGVGDRDGAAPAPTPNSHPPTPRLIPIGSNIAVAPPPGYQRAGWRAQLGVAEGETLVAYFGLISRSKGLDLLLDALAAQPPSVRLLVVGGAATTPADQAFAAEVERTLAALGLGGRATFTGHCPPDQVSAHLLAADMAALPFRDGASLRRGSLLAALGHGLPTITTTPAELGTENQEPAIATTLPGSTFSIPRLTDGENVLLVPPSDADALARALGALAADAGLRARLAAAGVAFAARFGWPAIAAQHEALYRRVLGEPMDG